MQQGAQQGHLGVVRLERGFRGIHRAARRGPRATGRHQDLLRRWSKTCFGWALCRALRGQDKAAAATLGLRRNLPFWAVAVDICKEFGASTVFDPEKRFTLNGDIGRSVNAPPGAQLTLGENWRAITVLQRDFRRAEAARSDARETLDMLLLSLVSLADSRSTT